MAVDALDNPIHLQVVTPTGYVVDEQVDEVVAPGYLGEFDARPGHQPYLVQLRPGALAYVKDGAKRWYSVSGGTAEVRATSVAVLADTCEPAVGIDVDRAERARTRAEKRLKAFKDAEVDRARASAALARAVSRVQAARWAR